MWGCSDARKKLILGETFVVPTLVGVFRLRCLSPNQFALVVPTLVGVFRKISKA